MGHHYTYQRLAAKHRAHHKRKNNPLNIGNAIRAELEKSLKQAAPNSQHPRLMNGNGNDETTSEDESGTDESEGDESEGDESEDEFEKIGSSKNITVADLIKDYGYKVVRQVMAERNERVRRHVFWQPFLRSGAATEVVAQSTSAVAVDWVNARVGRGETADSKQVAQRAAALATLVTTAVP